MIKNIIFDFGGVIAKFDPILLTKPYVDDEETQKLISNIVFDRKYWNKLDIGDITDDAVKKDFVNKLSPKHLKLAQDTYDNWINNLIPINGICNLIKKISATDIKLYLLSDISEGFVKSYKNVKWIDDVLSYFDGLVFSSVEHKVKPHVETFENVINKYNLKPDECLFVDDNPLNIDGAKKIGIKGYVFDGDTDRLTKYLNDI